jgi:hypothetical protein
MTQTMYARVNKQIKIIINKNRNGKERHTETIPGMREG